MTFSAISKGIINNFIAGELWFLPTVYVLTNYFNLSILTEGGKGTLSSSGRQKWAKSSFRVHVEWKGKQGCLATVLPGPWQRSMKKQRKQGQQLPKLMSGGEIVMLLWKKRKKKQQLPLNKIQESAPLRSIDLSVRKKKITYSWISLQLSFMFIDFQVFRISSMREVGHILGV